MNRRNVTGQQEIFQVHQASDGQPALDSRWRSSGARGYASFQSAYPEIEDAPKPNIQKKKGSLVAAPRKLRIVAV